MLLCTFSVSVTITAPQLPPHAPRLRPHLGQLQRSSWSRSVPHSLCLLGQRLKPRFLSPHSCCAPTAGDLKKLLSCPLSWDGLCLLAVWLIFSKHRSLLLDCPAAEEPQEFPCPRLPAGMAALRHLAHIPSIYM